MNRSIKGLSSGLNFIFLIKQFVIFTIKCQKMSSSNVLFCSQPENIQFTVIEEEKHTFKKLESENCL